jgi:hypothetical protein
MRKALLGAALLFSTTSALSLRGKPERDLVAGCALRSATNQFLTGSECNAGETYCKFVPGATAGKLDLSNLGNAVCLQLSVSYTSSLISYSTTTSAKPINYFEKKSAQVYLAGTTLTEQTTICNVSANTFISNMTVTALASILCSIKMLTFNLVSLVLELSCVPQDGAQVGPNGGGSLPYSGGVLKAFSVCMRSCQEGNSCSPPGIKSKYDDVCFAGGKFDNKCVCQQQFAPTTSRCHVKTNNCDTDSYCNGSSGSCPPSSKSSTSQRLYGPFCLARLRARTHHFDGPYLPCSITYTRTS